MILSEKYKFILIKSKKVAGTSVEVFLSNNLDDNAIVTPVSTLNFFNKIRILERDHEENWRNKKKPARNYKGNFYEESIIWLRQFQNYLRRYLINKFNKIFRPQKHLDFVHLKRANKYYDHMTIEEVKANLGSEHFKKFQKVGIIRNPIDQAISDYWDSQNRIETGRKYNNFNEYMDDRLDFFFNKVRQKYLINNIPAMDKYLKYENLKTDLKSFIEDVGINADINELDKLKIHGSYRKNKNSKKDILENLKDADKKRIMKSAGWLGDFYK